MKYKVGDKILIFTKVTARIHEVRHSDSTYKIVMDRDGTIIDHNITLLDVSEDVTLLTSTPMICECGSLVSNSLGHSSWCPIYEVAMLTRQM